MTKLPTAFSSHKFTEQIADEQIVFRVLKMNGSNFIYIGKKDSEEFSGLAIGFTSQQKESLSTSVVESPESRELAQKLSLRLSKPVIVSYNGSVDRFVRPSIEQRLIKEIKDHPEYF